MSPWQSAFQKPEELQGSDALLPWFGRIAACLLRDTDFVVGGEPHRFAEIEFYYFDQAGHPDKYTHRDPIQLECGRWYFHKTKGVYRGGSFKGLDISFGDGQNHAGVLIRSIVKPDGTLVDGPSLTVDHLLATTGKKTIAELDAEINERPVWDTTSPLHLRKAEPPHDQPIHQSGRIGLGLKWGKPKSMHSTYVLRKYRFLNEPKNIKKGKVLLVLALHAEGKTVEEIQAVTGSAAAHVRKYIEDFESGKAEDDFGKYFGKDLNTAELCRLHGTWYKHHG